MTKSRGALAALAIVILLGVGIALWLRGRPHDAEHVGAAESVFGAGPLEVGVEPHPAVPRAGANELRLRLRDERGAPVEDAEVELRYSMQMAGMAPMGGRAMAQPMAPGEYRAEYTLDMAGTWQLAIEARRPSGESVRAEGSLTTGTPGLRIEGAAAPGAPATGAGHEAHGAPAAGHEGHAAHGPPPATERADAAPGAAPTVRIDTERRQRIGVRVAPIERGPFSVTLRAVGRVAWDETTLVDVAPRIRGWVETLEADSLGAPVRRGAPLLSLYSPELHAAQEEYLQALRSARAAAGSERAAAAEALARAARRRLRLWEVSEADLEALARRGTPLEALPLRSPADGYLVEKSVVLGGAVEPGMRIFRIAPLDRVWIEAQIYESDLAAVRVGQSAQVSLPYLPGQRFEARVAYLYPALESDTRSARLRLELANPDLVLRPDMYADVELRVERGERTLVPASAVIHAGPRRLVFVDLGDGRLEPREIEIGLGNGEVYEVLAGLEPGTPVVVSGNFLVAAESRLKSALERW